MFLIARKHKGCAAALACADRDGELKVVEGVMRDVHVMHACLLKQANKQTNRNGVASWSL